MEKVCQKLLNFIRSIALFCPKKVIQYGWGSQNKHMQSGEVNMQNSPSKIYVVFLEEFYSKM